VKKVSPVPTKNPRRLSAKDRETYLRPLAEKYSREAIIRAFDALRPRRERGPIAKLGNLVVVWAYIDFHRKEAGLNGRPQGVDGAARQLREILDRFDPACPTSQGRLSGMYYEAEKRRRSDRDFTSQTDIVLAEYESVGGLVLPILFDVKGRSRDLNSKPNGSRLRIGSIAGLEFSTEAKT
jgi:hypothetical protein